MSILITKTFWEQQPFNDDGYRCHHCEKINAQFKIFLEPEFSRHYCLDCLINKKCIWTEGVSENTNNEKCSSCKKYVEKLCFIVATDYSGMSSFSYCKECTSSLINFLDKNGGKLYGLPDCNGCDDTPGVYVWCRINNHLIPTRHPIVPALRHEVLKNGNFKCQDCGASKNEVKLEVDHIIPVSQGGNDELSNLQVLCKECNRAKGNRSWIGGEQ